MAIETTAFDNKYRILHLAKHFEKETEKSGWKKALLAAQKESNAHRDEALFMACSIIQYKFPHESAEYEQAQESLDFMFDFACDFMKWNEYEDLFVEIEEIGRAHV